MIVILIHRWHLLMRFQYYSELTKCDYLTIEWFMACKYGFAINPSCFERSNIRQQFQLFNKQRIIIFKRVITLSNNKNAVCYQLSPDIYSSSSSLSIVWNPIVYCSYFTDNFTDNCKFLSSVWIKVLSDKFTGAYTVWYLKRAGWLGPFLDCFDIL